MLKLWIRNPCNKCIVKATCGALKLYNKDGKTTKSYAAFMVVQKNEKWCNNLKDYHDLILKRRNFFLKWLFVDCRLCADSVFKPLARMYYRAPNTFCKQCNKRIMITVRDFAKENRINKNKSIIKKLKLRNLRLR